jgi:hypothetical protein
MSHNNGGTGNQQATNDPPESELAVLAIRRAVLDLLIAPIRPNPTPSNGCLQSNSTASGNTDSPRTRRWSQQFDRQWRSPSFNDNKTPNFLAAGPFAARTDPQLTTGRFTMSKSVTATLSAVLAVAAALASAHSYAQGQGNNPTGLPNALNVNVTNTPLPVTGTVSGTVTITNQPNVFVTNTAANPVPVTVATTTEPVRFTSSFSRPGNPNEPTSAVIPADAVPVGKILIVAYATLFGQAQQGATIAQAGCQLRLITSTSTSQIGAIPMRTDLAGASASEPMFLPVHSGEGLGLLCSTNPETSFWRVTFSGYLVPAP